MRRAVEGLSVTPQQVLVDGRRLKDLDIPQQPLIKGDAKSLTIAAASILAKTARDAVMQKLDAQHPGYGFSKHEGYPCSGAFDGAPTAGRVPHSPAFVRPGPRGAGFAATPAMAGPERDYFVRGDGLGRGGNSLGRSFPEPA